MTETGNEIFDLEFGVNTIRVQRLEVQGQTFFNVTFSNQIPSLNLLRATNAQDEKFWTSVPEGRLALAQQIGSLIEDYYRSKK